MKYLYDTYSHIGSRRSNQDSYAVCIGENGFAALVADGLGGYSGGELASKICIETVENAFEKPDDFSLDVAITEANENILQMQQELDNAMKTTAAALVTDGKHAYIGHVGDSRVYVFYKNKVKRRTLDHSIPQMLALSKEIKESEIRFHPDRSFVLRVMGVDWEEPMYELLPPEKLKKCQAFLLCSDGFWEWIDEAEMCSLLRETDSAEEWLRRMTERVVKNAEGSDMDNYSAIAVWNTR